MKITYPIICLIIAIVMAFLMKFKSSTEDEILIILEGFVFVIAAFLTILLTYFYFKDQ